jgi:hypothetical protein
VTAFAATGISTFNTTAGNKTATLAGTTAGDLLVVVAAQTAVSIGPGITDDNSSGTYTSVVSAGKNTGADIMYVFVRNSLIATTASTIITMTSGGGDTGGGLFVYRLTGMSKVGAAAVRQSKTQQNQTANAAPAPTFSAAALTTNSIIGAVFDSTNPPSQTAPTSFTEQHDVGYNSPATGCETVTIDSGFTGTTVTWGATDPSGAWCSVIVEFDASSAAAAVIPDVYTARVRT